MDISGAQLNSAAISAYNAQLQTAVEQNRQAERPAPQLQPMAAEVRLSQEGRDQAAREGSEDVRMAQEVPARPPEKSAPVMEAPTAERAVTPRESAPPPQPGSTDTASSYTARVASQSYFSVSNF